MTLTQQETQPIILEEPSTLDEPIAAVVDKAQPRWASIPALLSTMFGVDLRSLAVFRIVLGVVMLQDLLGRWSDLALHYSDRGLLSREQVLDSLNVWRWSLYFVNGTKEFAYLMFAITVVTCLAVIVGYRTRLAMVVLWILLVSLQVRNPLVLSGADSFLRLLMFWAMFLPVGAVWSIDQRLARGTPSPRPWYVSVASAALLLQIAFVYFFTALLKTGDEWRALLCAGGKATHHAARRLDLPVPGPDARAHGVDDGGRGRHADHRLRSVEERANALRRDRDDRGPADRHHAHDEHRHLPVDQLVVHGLFPADRGVGSRRGLDESRGA
jgi:hypothetical protein